MSRQRKGLREGLPKGHCGCWETRRGMGTQSQTEMKGGVLGGGGLSQASSAFFPGTLKGSQRLRWVREGRVHLGRPRLAVITESRQELMVAYTTAGGWGGSAQTRGVRISGWVLGPLQGQRKSKGGSLRDGRMPVLLTRWGPLGERDLGEGQEA